MVGVTVGVPVGPGLRVRLVVGDTVKEGLGVQVGLAVGVGVGAAGVGLMVAVGLSGGGGVKVRVMVGESGVQTVPSTKEAPPLSLPPG
jgi:hypothetical protein